MAKEDIKKHLDLLRTLYYEGGLWDRRGLAQRLNIQPSTLDKLLREWKEILARAGVAEELEVVRRGYSRLRYRQWALERVFILSYRLGSLKEKEKGVIGKLLKQLAVSEQPQTEAEFQEANADVDGRTLRRHLRQLSEEGVIRDQEDGYCLEEWLGDLALQLGEQGRQQLRDFVDYAAAVSSISVPGYWILDALYRYDGEQAHTDANRLWYRHNPAGRILDELRVEEINTAIEEGKQLIVDYYPRQAAVRSQNQRQGRIVAEKLQFIPLALRFDQDFGRWYVVGIEQKQLETACSPEKLQVLRVENIAWLEEIEGDKQGMVRWQQWCGERLQISWLVEVREAPIVVQAKFYPPSTGPDYIGERVRREGRWSTIRNTDDGCTLISIQVRGWQEIAPWLRSFGGAVEVLAPTELRQEMISHWKEIKRRYGETTRDT